MPIFPLMLVLASAQAAPAASEPDRTVKIFGDWAVGCDNGASCEMTSLLPEGEEGNEAYQDVFVSLGRLPGAGGALTVLLELPNRNGRTLSLRIDGVSLASQAVRNDSARFEGDPALRIARAMVAGKTIEVADASGAAVGTVSLSGASAALRFIDARQGRAGTVTAIVATGRKPAASVPAPPAIPTIRSIRPSGTPERMDPALRKRLDAESGCGAEFEGDVGSLPEVDTFALGGGKTLALLPCGRAAYNVPSVPYILAGGKAEIAGFDSSPDDTGAEGDAPALINAWFDSKTGILGSRSKGRGVGDCGSSASYVWDSSIFRQIEERDMPDCRGSTNWLRTLRASTVPK